MISGAHVLSILRFLFSQVWEFAPHSFLKIAHIKEWQWVMHSCRSLKKTDREGITLIVMLQKSDHEWFAPNVLDKRVTVSKLLLSLFKKERHEWFTYDLSESLSKMSNLLESVSQLFLFFMPKSEESDSLYKRGTVTELLRSFMTKSYRSDSLFFTRESLFCSRKRSNSLKKPLSEFQTLCFLQTQSLTVTRWEKHSCLHVLYCTHRWITFYICRENIANLFFYFRKIRGQICKFGRSFKLLKNLKWRRVSLHASVVWEHAWAQQTGGVLYTVQYSRSRWWDDLLAQNVECQLT